jgi:Calcium-activated chloride channel
LIAHNIPECSLGIAFVTFQTKCMQKKVLSYWGNSKKSVFNMCMKKNEYKCSKSNENYNIEVFDGPPPSDVIWENLDVNFWVRKRRMIYTFLITQIVLVIFFITVILLKLAQRRGREKEEEKELKGEKSSSGLFSFVSFLISLLILIINQLISMFLTKITHFERHMTQTEFNTSLTVKICISQFINTCFLINISHHILYNPAWQIWAKGKLIHDIIFL